MALSLCPSAGAQGPPAADQILTELGFSAADLERVLAGEFVTRGVTAISERDLSVSMAFLIKTSPEELARQFVEGDLVTADPQVRSHGGLRGDASLADFAGLHIPERVAKAYQSARPGDALNLSTAEIAAFDAVEGGVADVEEQLRKMLLARYRAYRASGLAGIPPCDRGAGKTTDAAADLRDASTSGCRIAKYCPILTEVLLQFPRATLPELEQEFFWANYDIDDTPIYVLTHQLSAPDGTARAVVQRQFYVSTLYHAEQAVSGFVAVQQGTLVTYVNHTFTDQVAGIGGSVKRGIGRRMMLQKLEQVFDRDRRLVEH